MPAINHRLCLWQSNIAWTVPAGVVTVAQVFPGPPSDRVLLWFQGGGGCWDYESCFREDIALATTSVSLNSQGIFNLANETNPIVRGNWTIVHANYCSGDLFIGNATQEFKALNSSATGTATFGGANNTLVCASAASQPGCPGPHASRGLRLNTR